MDVYGQAREPWQHNTFRTTLRKRLVESEIITRLLAEDPAFRQYLTRMFVDALNHRVTERFLKDRFEHYRSVAERYGVRDLGYLNSLEQFLARRPDRVRRLLARYAGAGPSYRCRVEGPAGITLEIDGYPEPSGFSGSYFRGMEVSVALAEFAMVPTSQTPVPLV